jgi:ribonuclease HI
VNAGDQQKSAEEVCHFINKHLLEFGTVPKPVVVPASQTQNWAAPPAQVTKVNLDASYVQDVHNGSYGFVARSDDGAVIAAGAGKLYNLRSALHVEASACVIAMEEAANLGLHRVQFESDCSNLIKAIKDGNQDLSDIGVLNREARSLKLMHFDTADFLFCGHECNKVAHRLAQFG